MAIFTIPGHASAQKANRQLKARLVQLDPSDPQYSKCRAQLGKVHKQLRRYDWIEEKQMKWADDMDERNFYRQDRLGDAKRVHAKILRGAGEVVLEGTMLVIEIVMYTPVVICVLAPFSAGVM
jgi:hypothetical protein